MVGGNLQLQIVLGQLVRAATYAGDADCDRWDFAVEIASVTAAGASTSELRWLVSKRYAEHACEVTHSDDSRRRFRPCQRHLGFGPRTCFVLTEKGTLLVASLRLGAAVAERAPLAASIRFPCARIAGVGIKPSWDGQRHVLSLGNQIIKQYRVPAVSQAVILTAFEEECWPAAIDDPLPPQPEQDPKRRLRDTIRNLNANQQTALLRFRGDGSGCRILWELQETELKLADDGERAFRRAA